MGWQKLELKLFLFRSVNFVLSIEHSQTKSDPARILFETFHYLNLHLLPAILHLAIKLMQLWNNYEVNFRA